jgi:hypothetical protein
MRQYRQIAGNSLTFRRTRRWRICRIITSQGSSALDDPTFHYVNPHTFHAMRTALATSSDTVMRQPRPHVPNYGQPWGDPRRFRTDVILKPVSRSRFHSNPVVNPLQFFFTPTVIRGVLAHYVLCHIPALAARIGPVHIPFHSFRAISEAFNRSPC